MAGGSPLNGRSSKPADGASRHDGKPGRYQRQPEQTEPEPVPYGQEIAALKAEYLERARALLEDGEGQYEVSFQVTFHIIKSRPGTLKLTVSGQPSFPWPRYFIAQWWSAVSDLALAEMGFRLRVIPPGADPLTGRRPGRHS